MPALGAGENGVVTTLVLRGVVGGVRVETEVVALGVSWLVMRGMRAAMSNIVASLEAGVDAGTEAEERGPMRPRVFHSMRRPSRAPSKSAVFGGSCLVQSPAACMNSFSVTYNKI